MIKSKVKTVKGLVKQLRAVRDEMNAALEHMTSEQRTAYSKKMREKKKTEQQGV